MHKQTQSASDNAQPDARTGEIRQFASWTSMAAPKRMMKHSSVL